MLAIVLQHLLSFTNSSFSTIIPDVVNGLEELCIEINEFLLLLFGYLKYLFALLLMILGGMTLLKVRGVYLMERLRNKSKFDENESFKDKIKKTHVILGMAYMFMGFGLIFNYLIYILIWVLEPLPDKLFFQFIDIGGFIEPQYILRISIYDFAIAPHEKTIYLCLAYISLISLITITVSIWFLSKGGDMLNHPKGSFSVFIGGVMAGILAGFTTCLPFLI
ncbi:MAG: conserved membrane protein of unknown function [Promethearchaeota archaeon]|nr:MAG: conserved membrane protein of unknown function [Candidatus Lokiarchaeota archaeon]